MNKIKSLSARRAWIEIQYRRNGGLLRGVALRKESVDRNFVKNFTIANAIWSLSARRAWIEISITLPSFYQPLGRSPQGERG